jgi:hypothetical protein
MNRSNIILTGVQRSGTTLACYLLNKLPDTVALHEPMDVSRFPKLHSHDAICKEINHFFEEMRFLIKTYKVAVSKQINGKVPDNPFSDKYSLSGLRLDKTSISKISVEKKLSRNFLLVIKHPAAFTAILESLVKQFLCYAIIRNPLSVLASWNSVATPFQNGHAPAAEALDLSLAQALHRIEDRIERQFHLLSWSFENYLRRLPDKFILRYEDIISSGGKALNIITPLANQLNESLENKNKNKLYNREIMRLIGEKLLNSDGAYWKFYSKESVELLLN